MYQRRGLGDNWVLDSSGTPVDCSAFAGLFNLTCWNPLATSTSAPVSSNYGAASDPAAAMAAMTPAQQAQDAVTSAYLGNADAQIAQGLTLTSLLNPFTSAPGSPCSWYQTLGTDGTCGVSATVLIVGAAVVVGVLFLGKRR